MDTTNFLLTPLQTAAPLSKHFYKSYATLAASRHRLNIRLKARPARCYTAMATARLQPEKVIVRRSGNYSPAVYSFDFIQSLDNGYKAEKYMERANELKEQVKAMFLEDMVLLDCLELVDNLERLGLAYHFEHQIHSTLSSIFSRKNGSAGLKESKKDLYTLALEFRVFRRRGFHVSQDIFGSFMNEDGEFYPGLRDDTRGILALYEACFLSSEGELKLDVARELATEHLKTKLDNRKISDQNLSSLVQHALELPLRWRVPRREARWYIDAYDACSSKNPILVELAKLDFNIVQAIHQQDLKDVARWWKDTQIAEKLPFIRDRMVEAFFWSSEVISEPQHSSCRRMLAKLFVLTTSIDDVYDVYGTLDELELLTRAIERWDVKAMDELPDYMKVVFLLFFNTINEMAYDVLKEQGVHTIEHLSKGWAGVWKAQMQEARWYYSKYTPSVEEYIENATISTFYFGYFMHVYTAITNPMNMETLRGSLDCINPHNIVRWSSLLGRLVGDLGTEQGEMQRGDVAKIVQCYMKERSCSEAEAKEHVWCLIMETWKKMNGDCMAASPFSTPFVSASLNLGKIVFAAYQHGDGYGLISNPEATKDIHSSFFDPIPVSLY